MKSISFVLKIRTDVVTFISLDMHINLLSLMVKMVDKDQMTLIAYDMSKTFKSFLLNGALPNKKNAKKAGKKIICI